MFSRRRIITESDLQAAVRGAVQDATTSTQLSGHMVKCEEDKAAIRAELKQQGIDREKMHAENQDKFHEQDEKLNKVMRFVWMAAGAGAAISIISRLAGH